MILGLGIRKRFTDSRQSVGTEISEIFARILFSRIALKCIF